MCGIAGMVRADGRPAEARLVQAMTDVLSHRGPDGDGMFIEGPVAVGHRRLAIIDLSTGDQPMFSDDRSRVVVFNGEIYNYRELRRELEASGVVFRTASDTEVLLRSYEKWDVGCLERLRGMFAFALWDGGRRRLFLARDRVGIKPLVYAWDGRRFLFASEIKALLQHATVSRDLDWDALRDYLVFHYIPCPRTIFRAVRKLPPASYLLLEEGRSEPEIRRYWDLRFDPQERREEEWVEGLRWHLQDAVRSHMVSDVPVGAFLSGGVDSGSVVALMAQASTTPIRTFSIGFDEASFDELAYARAVAQRYGTDHCEFVVKPDALEVMPQLAWQLDEPFADASALPTYYVAKITREHVTVALSGDGGDENFAGYRRYAAAQRRHAGLDAFPGVLGRMAARVGAAALPSTARGRGYLELLGAGPVDRYFRMVTYQRDATLGRLLTAEAQRQTGTRADDGRFGTLAAASGAPDYVATLQYLDVRTYLPDDILAKVDRTSMLVSLESRVPLLDHVLMEYVATMPTRLKLAGDTGKAIFKRAMADALPDSVLERRKMGFGVPLGQWFRRELRDYARETLLGSRARQRGLFVPAAIEGLLAEHDSGRHDRSASLWALVMFEEWARRWLDG
jgi:asparagine synthase (glutamine-hydrolysing)